MGTVIDSLWHRYDRLTDACYRRLTPLSTDCSISQRVTIVKEHL